MVEIFRTTKHLVKEGCHVILYQQRKHEGEQNLFWMFSFVIMAKGDSKPRHLLGKFQEKNELGCEWLWRVWF